MFSSSLMWSSGYPCAWFDCPEDNCSMAVNTAGKIIVLPKCEQHEEEISKTHNSYKKIGDMRRNVNQVSFINKSDKISDLISNLIAQKRILQDEIEGREKLKYQLKPEYQDSEHSCLLESLKQQFKILDNALKIDEPLETVTNIREIKDRKLVIEKTLNEMMQKIKDSSPSSQVPDQEFNFLLNHINFFLKIKKQIRRYEANVGKENLPPQYSKTSSCYSSSLSPNRSSSYSTSELNRKRRSFKFSPPRSSSPRFSPIRSNNPRSKAYSSSNLSPTPSDSSFYKYRSIRFHKTHKIHIR